MHVAVIGGGVAGLTAALRLHQAGVDIRVLEVAAAPGGVVATRRDAGWLIEGAASAFTDAADGAIALCDELGVETVAGARAARRRWIYIDGKLRELPTSPIALARSDLLTWRGKADLLREPFKPPRDVDREGDESVHAFAARRFGPEAARAIVAPFVTGVFAADAHDISLAAGFPRLAALDRAGGVLRGMVRAMIAGRGQPRRRRGLFAPVAGSGALIEALATRLGAAIATSTPVGSLAPGAGGELVIESAGGAERFDAVVIATPARVAAQLLNAGVPEMATRLTELSRAPAAVVHLGYAAERVAHPLDGFGFLVARGEELRVLGVLFESSVWPGRAPAGHVLLRCILGGARDPEAAGLADDELIAQARADLARALGIEAAPVRAGVIRTSAGIAQYPVGHLDRIATLDSLAGQHRLVLAGADYHGIAINDVIADARRVVTEVARWR